jgi:hypothetical protein
LSCYGISQGATRRISKAQDDPLDKAVPPWAGSQLLMLQSLAYWRAIQLALTSAFRVTEESTVARMLFVSLPS